MSTYVSLNIMNNTWASINCESSLAYKIGNKKKVVPRTHNWHNALHDLLSKTIKEPWQRAFKKQAIQAIQFFFFKSSQCKGSRRENEGDNSYKPFARIIESDRPTIVFEIGVPGSLAQLQLDAKYWIEDSQGKTHVVIIGSINRVAESLLIERWHDTPGTTLQW